MGFWSILSRLFRKDESLEDMPLTPEIIESLPEADDASFYRDSKRLLQRFDEFITASEVECEALSIELDNTLEMQAALKEQLRTLNKPKSWHERHLLLKLNRLQLHGDNLKQRIEIYSQNIKIYLNLISKIQDIKAMRMNGLDEEKIETIWIEFKDTVDQYRERVTAEEAGFGNESITSPVLEEQLETLRKDVMGINDKKEEKIEEEKEEETVLEKIRPPLEHYANILDKKEEPEEPESEENELIAE
jgi:hypothetical protein